MLGALHKVNGLDRLRTRTVGGGVPGRRAGLGRSAPRKNAARRRSSEEPSLGYIFSHPDIAALSRLEPKRPHAIWPILYQTFHRPTDFLGHNVMFNLGFANGGTQVEGR